MFVKRLCPPFPNISRIGLTFDLYLSPIDLKINRDHLLIKDYLPTKFEASWEKGSSLSVAQGVGYQHDLWPRPFTWPEYQLGSSSHQGLSTYQVWSFWGKAFSHYQLHKVKGDRHTDQQTGAKQYAPPFYQRGRIYILYNAQHTVVSQELSEGNEVC